MVIFWHRQDLRVADNEGLAVAAELGSVSPVFVLDPGIIAHAGPPRMAFLRAALSALRSRYRDLGTDLLVRVGDPGRLLPELADELDATAVVWNRDYSGLARDRDDTVRAVLTEQEIDVHAVHDSLHHEPGSIRTNDGDVYSVFSYFWQKWRNRPKDDPVDVPTDSAFAGVDGKPIPSRAELDVAAPEATVPAAGPDAARTRLDAFCDGPIFDYEEARDYPAREGTSRLSPHLTFGTIGPRTVYAATEDALWAAETEADRESVEAYRRQLAWREFYAHTLWNRPELVTENARDFPNEIEWRNDPDELHAWKNGRTGYPIVDAGMRQLREEAWMHNRVRMIVASFLIKDLMIDWREGYAHFRAHLVDHDTANDVGGWQWAASTGMDAQPYFRVFNPMTQGERYDPEATYVRSYIPALRDVPVDDIHGWDELDTERRAALAPAYPDPIVDHGTRREAAIEMFERARGG